MEIEYVRGSFPGEKMAKAVRDAAFDAGIRLTVHGPYYINLNAAEPEKREASRRRIVDSAYYGSLSGAESLTFHAGYYLGGDPEIVYTRMKDELSHVDAILRERGIAIDMRPETSGSPKEYGSLSELLKLSLELDFVLPCIDWAHLHAVTGAVNTTQEFETVLESVRKALGDEALSDSHMHVSGIEYTSKGEKKHCALDESDFNYRDLMRVLSGYDVKGILICESPLLEYDALKLKECC